VTKGLIAVAACAILAIALLGGAGLAQSDDIEYLYRAREALGSPKRPANQHVHRGKQAKKKMKAAAKPKAAAKKMKPAAKAAPAKVEKGKAKAAAKKPKAAGKARAKAKAKPAEEKKP